jgi:type I restriction enzyme S subunit
VELSFGEDLSTLIAENAKGVLSAAPGWQRKPLGEVAKILNGFPFDSKYFSHEAGKPLIRIRNVIDGQTETYYNGPIPEGYWVNRGDFLVGMDGDFNSSLWKGEPALLNQRVCKITPNEKIILKDFLVYLLPGYLRLINEYTSSVTVKHLSSRTLQELPLPIPDISVQRTVLARIDALFAEIDDGEAALAEARAGVETYRKSLLKAAVTGELTADWRRDNPQAETGEDLLRRILAERRARWEADPKNRKKKYVEPQEPDFDQLPVLPDSWRWATISEITSQSTYGTSVKCDVNPAGVPVIRMGNIQDETLDLSNMKYTSHADGLPILEVGDILFNRTNSAELLGKSAVYSGELRPCSFASYIVAIRVSQVRPHFIASWINSIYGRAWIAENKSQQVGQANLSAGKLMSMPVPIPPLAEQDAALQKLGAALVAVRSQVSASSLAESNVSTLRQSILSAAFRGDLA